MDEATGKEAEDWYLTSRILMVNFAAIHTSTMVRRTVSPNWSWLASDYSRFRPSHMRSTTLQPSRNIWFLCEKK